MSGRNRRNSVISLQPESRGCRDLPQIGPANTELDADAAYDRLKPAAGGREEVLLRVFDPLAHVEAVHEDRLSDTNRAVGRKQQPVAVEHVERVDAARQQRCRSARLLALGVGPSGLDLRRCRMLAAPLVPPRVSREQPLGQQWAHVSLHPDPPLAVMTGQRKARGEQRVAGRLELRVLDLLGLEPEVKGRAGRIVLPVDDGRDQAPRSGRYRFD